MSFAVSQALEVIPLVLAENAGVEPTGAVERLRSAVDQEGGGQCGINGYTGAVGDMAQQMVLEPLYLKQRALSSSFETVRALLHLGGVYVEEPAHKMIRKGPPPLSGARR